MELLLSVALAVAVAASGWWSRYEIPIVASLVVAGAFARFAPDTLYPLLDAGGAGAILAYLRRPVVIEEYRARGKVWRSFW